MPAEVPRSATSGAADGAASSGRVIVLGASAGGLETIAAVLERLSPSLAAPVCVVQHLAPYGAGRLPVVLGRRTALPVAHASDGATLRDGHVYVSPPDHHLVLEAGGMRLTRGPRENRQRPAVDALFRSAAYVYGPRAIGVVLTGALDDGTAGLWTIKDRGGTTIVQDPADAAFPSMPRSALEYVQVDHVVRAAELAPLLERLARQPVPSNGGSPVSDELHVTARVATGDLQASTRVFDLGSPSPFTCPDCSGVLVRLREGGVPTFRCHTGHAFSFDTLLAATTEHTEQVLWHAVRAAEETMLLLRHAAEHARARNDEATAALAERRAEEAFERSQMLAAVVARHHTLSQESLSRADDAMTVDDARARRTDDPITAREREPGR
jgi:two-component system chemotaxis response regulator CheB